MPKLLVLISCLLSASCANACSQLAQESLPVFWDEFRQVSLRGHVEDITRYYKFPLRLKGPFDDDKEVVLTKRKFLENYEVIFRQGMNEEALLFKTLKEKPAVYWHEEIRRVVFPGGRCIARIDDYELTWAEGAGWKIVDLYYLEEFSRLGDYVKRSHK